MAPLIQVDKLAKHFRRPHQFDGPFGGLRSFFTHRYTTVKAVEGVSFSIDEGELVGYLGANGAGKSTSIKMLSGILAHRRGAGHGCRGLVPWRRATGAQRASRIGVVFGQRTQLWWDLPLRDSLATSAALYRMDEGATNATARTA